jgi:glutamine synthetase
MENLGHFSVEINSPDGLSDTALHFTAGILHHVQALTALMAPTINCYHRFKKKGPMDWSGEKAAEYLQTFLRRQRRSHRLATGRGTCCSAEVACAGAGISKHRLDCAHNCTCCLSVS